MPLLRFILPKLRFSSNFKTFRPSISVGGIYSSAKMSTMLKSFDEAKQRLSTLKEDPGNDVKLKMYGLFKQATIGECNTAKPSSFDFVGKAKWEAWHSLGKMKNEDAMKQYVSIVDELVKTSSEPMSSSSTGGGKYDGITYVVDGAITRITFNRPSKRNAITVQMYKDFQEALKEAGKNDTSVAVITGQGEYYSSGNDLSNFTLAAGGDVGTLARDAGELLKAFVASFIEFPKPLIAAVNGPAVGIPVTLLGLFDAVYVNEKATFLTPFTLLGQTPEACATYTFPKLMGNARANEVLMFNKKMTALEAKDAGLVTEVFADAVFQKEVESRITTISALSKNSMLYSKKLIRDIDRETLHKVNEAECERLVERWQSQDCMEAIMNFFQRKAKL